MSQSECWIRRLSVQRTRRELEQILDVRAVVNESGMQLKQIAHRIPSFTHHELTLPALDVTRWNVTCWFFKWQMLGCYLLGRSCFCRPTQWAWRMGVTETTWCLWLSLNHHPTLVKCQERLHLSCRVMVAGLSLHVFKKQEGLHLSYFDSVCMSSATADLSFWWLHAMQIAACLGNSYNNRTNHKNIGSLTPSNKRNWKENVRYTMLTKSSMECIFFL